MDLVITLHAERANPSGCVENSENIDTHTHTSISVPYRCPPVLHRLQCSNRKERAVLLQMKRYRGLILLYSKHAQEGRQYLCAIFILLGEEEREGRGVGGQCRQWPEMFSV